MYVHPASSDYQCTCVAGSSVTEKVREPVGVWRVAWGTRHQHLLESDLDLQLDIGELRVLTVQPLASRGRT